MLHTFDMTAMARDSGKNYTGILQGSFGVRALLKSKDGRGLRCDLQGRSHGGTGLCVDDKNKAYDVVMILRD